MRSKRSLAGSGRASARLPRTIVTFFDNLGIRTKLLLYAGVLIALTLGLATFALHQVRIIHDQQLPARSAARTMETALLLMRINEQQLTAEAESGSSEFYLKHQSNSVDAWKENFRQFGDNYAKILELFSGTDIAAQLEPVKGQLEAYESTFLSLVDVYQERGFQSFGREGAINQRAEALEASLAGRPQVLVSMLKIQEAQDDFFLHQEVSDVIDFNNYAAQLDKQLTNIEERTLLEEYRNLFQEVVKLYETIGFSANDGLRGQLGHIISDITPRVDSAERDVLALTDANIAAVSRSILIATSLIILVGILMAVALAKFITRRLQQLLQAAERITKGDLEYRLQAKTNDELGHLAGAFNDMTQKLADGRKVLHQRAQALTASVRRFELVSRAVNEAIYEWNVKTDALTWGEGIVSVFGYTRQNRQTDIEWWAQHIHPDDAQAVNDSLNSHILGHASTWKAVYRFKKANGQYAYCQDHGFIEYQHGQPLRMVGSIVDITHQKELEQAKDEFISIASHQLRTPLGSIRWNLDLLMEKLGEVPRDSRIYIQEAYNSTMRMLGLVGSLLSVARIEQGRVQNIPEEVDLAAVIGAAVTEMQPIARQQNVRIDSTALKQKKVAVVIDPKQFREVIQNLLSNAVKYTPAKGKVTVKVEIDTKNVLVSIADTGIGIPDEAKNSMFSKFFRAKNVTTTDTEGSGLGLFVVKSYVERWGGRIWFTSQLNKGTTFYVSIPRKTRLQKPKT